MPARLSIGVKLPLLICGLLVAVIGTLAWAAYDETRRSALLAASERLERVTGQLRDQIEASTRQRLAELRELAAHPAVRAYFATADARIGRRALDAVAQRSRQTETITAFELWDSLGVRLLAAGRALPPVDSAALRLLRQASTTHTGAAIGPLAFVGDSLLYPVAAAVSDGPRVLGYVVQRRRVVPRAADQIAELIGAGATVLVGNAGTDFWTDFTVPAPGPPVEVTDAAGVVEYEHSGRGGRLAAAARVRSAPWVLLIEFPRDPVLARPRAFLARVTVIALLLVAIGAAGAWALSRHITRPLKELTAAAGAIAAGGSVPRVAAQRGDELGRLAHAFNAMAAQVADVQRHLEEQVVARTHELQAKEERLRAITDTAHDAIVSADHRGNVTYWNPGAQRIFGYTAAEVLSRPLTTLMPERYHEAHRQGLARFLATREARVVGRTVELAGRRKDGREFPLELSLAASGTPEAPTFTAVIRDITERTRAHAELRESHAELEAFTYTVSHDLRAPLRAMQGFAKALLEDYGAQLDAKAQDYCDRIVNAANRMDALIQDLLAYSRLARAELALVPVSLQTAAHDAVAQLDGVLKERRAELTIEPGLPAVVGHHATLVQALANLVGNGIKFTAPETTPRVRLWAERRGGDVRIWIEDNGIGIALEHQERIFRVFERLHRAERYPGTGIGLAMVKRSVERMAGRVGVISNPGTGSRFWIDLPAEGPRT